MDIRIEGLTLRYGEAVAVRNLDLTVGDGESLVLLGESGCGKTSTMRCIAGLERPSAGRIAIGGDVLFDGERNIDRPPHKRNIGMVFQSYAIWPHMTVFENVAFPLSMQRVCKADIARRVRETLELVGLAEFADRGASMLSGGQMQRVALARSVVMEPSVMLLDEPLSNLDARLRTQMGDEFRQLQQRLKITALYVTHDQAEAMALSDRVVVMHAGKILQVGPPEEIYRRPDTRQVAAFFGTPNLLDATVKASRANGHDAHRLTVEGQGWSGECLSGTDIAPGSAVSVMVRPESLALADAVSAPAGLRWSGEVVQSIFRGSHRSITVQTPAQKLHVDASPLADVAVGKTVTVTAPADAAWAIRR